jgi:NAD(P)-dependent dehydrogenase (short-subunit alcohol dehydrogenase family)
MDAGTSPTGQRLSNMKNPFSLEGKRALVTGAGRGIGEASARALAAAGAHVTLMARTATEIESVADDIVLAGGAAEWVACDVTDTSAFRMAILALPACDIFLNNAGMNRPQAFQEVSEDNFDAIMNLNLRAAFFAAQAIAQRMIASGTKGSIITMSSQMGHVGGVKRSVYCASKFAMEGMTKAAAIDLAPHGIRINTICPTFIETPMVAGFLANQEFKDYVLSKIKLGRLGQPSDVTGAVVFLASDASALMTGTHLIIDGGWTAE